MNMGSSEVPLRWILLLMETVDLRPSLTSSIGMVCMEYTQETLLVRMVLPPFF